MVSGSDVAAIERWRIARGLPRFAERRDSATVIRGRALPVLTRLPSLVRSLDTFASWRQVDDLAAGTTTMIADLRPVLAADPWAERPPLRQRCDAGLLILRSPSIQVTIVGFGFGFGFGFAAAFVLFGLLAIPAVAIAARTTLDDLQLLGDLRVGGRTLVVTDPLLLVAGLLGALGAMSFTVLLATDATCREGFADDVAPPMRQALAVRCVDQVARGAA